MHASTYLGTEQRILVPSFDHAVGDPVPGAIVIEPSHTIVLVEGNYLLLGRLHTAAAPTQLLLLLHLCRTEEPPWGTLQSLFDETWFVDCEVDTAMARVFARQTAIGLAPEESRLRITNNDRPNALQVLASRPRATVLVPSVPYST